MIAFTANCLYTPLERVEQPLLLVDDHVIIECGSRSARQIPHGVRVVDFGIRGADLTNARLDGGESAILIAAAQRGQPPGTVTPRCLPRAFGDDTGCLAGAAQRSGTDHD